MSISAISPFSNLNNYYAYPQNSLDNNFAGNDFGDYGDQDAGDEGNDQGGDSFLYPANDSFTSRLSDFNAVPDIFNTGFSTIA